MDPVVLRALKVGMNESSQLASSMATALHGIERSQEKVQHNMENQVAEYEKLAIENGAPVNDEYSHLSNADVRSAKRTAHMESALSTISTIAIATSVLLVTVPSMVVGNELMAQAAGSIMPAAMGASNAVAFGAQAGYQGIQAKLRKESADTNSRIELNRTGASLLTPVLQAITAMIRNQLSSAQTLASTVSMATNASHHADVGRK